MRGRAPFAAVVVGGVIVGLPGVAVAVETPSPSGAVTSSPAATLVAPPAPVMDVETDTYTVPAVVGVDWYVNGALIERSEYGKPRPIGHQSLYIEAKPQAGYDFPPGMQTTWTLIIEPPLGVQVDNHFVESASVPTYRVTWSLGGATTYDVTYHKVLLDGSAGPEILWLKDTTRTTADFVAEPGDEYVVTVVGRNANGESAPGSTTVHVTGDPPQPIDITGGTGSFNEAWQVLGVDLPYFGGTAALGYRNARYTVTVPAGTTRFDLYATVHDLGAKGIIQVNGANWATFETNSAYWGFVAIPYTYPVRRVQGWDASQSATITVIATDAGTKYLALDAYRALT